jgi:hypothetical protein
MRHARWFLLLVALLVVGVPAAEATTIGSSITVTRLYPDLATVYTDPADAIPGVVTVTALVGADSGQASPQPAHYTVDLEATSIFFDFGSPSVFLGMPGPTYSLANPFDGLRFSGFGYQLLSASVGAASGITVTELFIQSNQLFVNLNGKYDSNAYVRLDLQFAPAAVPEPATLSLVVLGLCGAALRLGRNRLRGPSTARR